MSIHGNVANRARELVLENGNSVDRAVTKAIDELAEASSAPIDELELELRAMQEIQGFGFLDPFMKNPKVEEIWINKPGEVHFFTDRHHVQAVEFNSQMLRNLVLRLLTHSGRKVDRLTPYVDASLIDGSRLHVVIPEITRAHWSINIRKFRTGRVTLDHLESFGTISSSQASTLREAIKAQKSLLIIGATQAGKTTLMSALLAEVPADERIVSCEDTFEINLEHPDWIAMQVRPLSAEGSREINLRELVKQSLRMRPSRLVIGEVRGAEALDMLVALNSGIPGMCTLHANSARQGLQKLLTLPLLAGENITESFLRPTILGAFDLAIFCHRDQFGKRVVREILEVSNEILS